MKFYSHTAGRRYSLRHTLPSSDESRSRSHTTISSSPGGSCSVLLKGGLTLVRGAPLHPVTPARVKRTVQRVLLYANMLRQPGVWVIDSSRDRASDDTHSCRRLLWIRKVYNRPMACYPVEPARSGMPMDLRAPSITSCLRAIRR